MKKLLLALLLAVCFGLLTTEKASAQLGVQAGYILPIGDWSEFWGHGVGGKIYYKKSINDRMLLGGSIGGFVAQGKKVETLPGALVTTKNAKILPILITADYSLNKWLYAGLDLGYTIITHKTTAFSFSTGDANATDNVLALIPKVGIELKRMHVETRYNLIGSPYVTLLVGFRLKPIKILK